MLCLAGLELLAQTGFVFRALFVLASYTGFLVLFAAGWIGRFAAIDGRHLFLHALAEGWAALSLTCLGGLFAGCTMLRVGLFGTIDLL